MAVVECEDCGDDIEEGEQCEYCLTWEDEPREFEDY